MKNLVCNFLNSAKRLKKHLLGIIKDSFALIGGLVMIAETALEVFNFQGLFDFYRKHILIICIVILIICIFKNWERFKYTVKIKDSSDITITLRVIDALKNSGAVIIPTNSTFDTVMDDEFVSVGSIQGQYQNKFFKNRLVELDKKIEVGLSKKPFVVLNDGRKYKSNRYPIGTVCRINEKNRRAYFLADSDIDPNGYPIDVDASNVTQALVGLWYELSSTGNCEPYSIPIIGTGKARVKDASRNEVVRQIILTFLAASRDRKITESLTICIHPSDFEKIDWDGLCEFLKYQSQYSNVKPADTNSAGTAEQSPEIISFTSDLSGFVYDEDNNQLTNKDNKCIVGDREKILLALLTNNKLDLKEIAEAMNLSMSSAHQLLRKLQDNGLIICEGSEAKRRFYVPTKEK